MALTLVHDCPHCGANKMTFDRERISVREVAPSRYLFSLFFLCGVCALPVTVVISSDHTSLDFDKYFGDIKEHYGRQIRGIFPKPAPSDLPEHCPVSVAEAFLEAEDALRRRKFNSTVSMDRRALELMTKEKAPDRKGTLAQRIDWLSNQNLLTPALKDWATELRTMGNEALHEVDGLTEDEAESTHELTRFILTYVYTLPEQVRLAKEKRDAATEE